MTDGFVGSDAGRARVHAGGPLGDGGRLTDVEGIAVGNWTDAEARTGCTVVVLPPGTIGSADVRGGAPASRELALLEPTRTVQSIDAVVLTGGSAFGLASADGVVEYLAALGRGFPTAHGAVPIVAALGLYDLGVGSAEVRPDREAGLYAATNARAGGHDVGVVGAGTGFTVGKWRGVEHAGAGGLVAASATVGQDVVAALVAVNALGSVGIEATVPSDTSLQSSLGTNTTIGVVATTARLDKIGCNLLAQAAHDGLARAVFPAHTGHDGDAFIAVATGRGAAECPDVNLLRAAVCAVVERAILTLAV